MRLGTSSPKTKVKKDKTSVINITIILSSIFSEIGIPVFNIKFTKGAEKLSAAKADPRKPDKVIVTWIVAKKFAG